MDDLRNLPYSNAHADPSAYSARLKTKESVGLPIGTQQRFLDAE